MNQQSDPINHTDDGFRYPSLAPAQEQQCSRFAQLLQEGNRQSNLTRITETPDIFVRHFEDALKALPLLDAHGETGRLLDVGSGAGIPGLALAIARPSWKIDSLEATGKKVRFQQTSVETLALANATIKQGRAEDVGHQASHREGYDIVTARAVAALPMLLELCLPFVKTGGLFIAFKGASVREELAEAESAMAILGGAVTDIIPYTLKQEAIGDVAEQRFSYHLVVVRKQSLTPATYPRAYGVIRRKPL